MALYRLLTQWKTRRGSQIANLFAIEVRGKRCISGDVDLKETDTECIFLKLLLAVDDLALEFEHTLVAI